MAEITRPGPSRVEGMDMFEVYEADGSLLYVASFIDPENPPAPTDVVYRRPWATASTPFKRVGSTWIEATQ